MRPPRSPARPSSGTDPGLIRDRLGAEAYGNLMVLKALFGNRPYPGFESIPAKAIDLLGHDVACRVARIAGQHLPLVDDLPPSSLGDQTEVEYEFGVVMPTRTGIFEHIAEGEGVRKRD